MYQAFFWLTAALGACRLVLETLEPLPKDRKCYRMINGVLVERTVADVVPALKTNSEGLKKVLDDLLKQYKTKQEEMEKWKVRTILLVYAGCWLFDNLLFILKTASNYCTDSFQTNRKRTISKWYSSKIIVFLSILWRTRLGFLHVHVQIL